MGLKIVVRFSGMALQTFDLEPGSYEVGRGPENEININHPSIHRRHGQISMIQQRWVYQDHHTQKIQTIDDADPVFLSNEIDLATEAYTLSEKTVAFLSTPSSWLKNKKMWLSGSVVAMGLLLLVFAYQMIKKGDRQTDPNQLLEDVRAKVVEFERLRDPQAVEDYKTYGGFTDGDFRETMGYCTGFLVAPNVVLTASHCLWGSDFLDLQTEFDLRMHDGKTLKPTRLLGFDPIRDYLYLEVPGADAYGFLDFADDYKIGQTVYTLGNAHGQGIAIREGIMASETPDLNDPSIKFIRFSAGASPGNSGGPLLNSKGKIVALVFAATGAENYNLGTSCHDLKAGFDQFVVHQEKKEISIRAKKLFNFNLHNFLQKQILPFLPDYSEYPEVNQFVDQMELRFEVPIPFEKVSDVILQEVNKQSTEALLNVEKTLQEQKQVVLSWESYLSEKTPAILPSQFDSSQNSFYKLGSRYYMKVAGFLDSPNRKDFRSYLEQMTKEKKFDFQSYGMNIEYKEPVAPARTPLYLPNNQNKNKMSLDDLAQGALYNQMFVGRTLNDENLATDFLKNFVGEEGILSGTYSAFIRPQAYKTFTIKNLQKPMSQDKVKDGVGREWKRWTFRLFDQVHFYIYCLAVPEGVQCAARIFPVENEVRREIVESNFRKYILGHFLENPFFWEPSAVLSFLKSSPREGLTSLLGFDFQKQGSGSYLLKIPTFQIQWELPANMQSLRFQTGLFLDQTTPPTKTVVWTSYGAEWILGGENPQACGALIEPEGTQSLYALNFYRDLIKRKQLSDDNKKQEIPQYWTHHWKTPRGVSLQIVGYCAPLRENPIEVGAYFVDLKRAKPFTVPWKTFK